MMAKLSTTGALNRMANRFTKNLFPNVLTSIIINKWTFVNKEARFVNKPLKIILLVLAALVLLVVGYLAYVLIDYHRLGDMDLEVDRQVLQPAETGREYHLLSYNIGFGAYEPDYGFFMDGGTESWAWSQERLTAT